MTDTHTAPYHYTLPYVDRLKPKIPDSGSVTYSTELGTFDKPTYEEEKRIAILLTGIETLASKPKPEISPIVRAEFFKGGGGLDRSGVILFDATLKPVLHVKNALLGYRGSGPHLSRVILETLGTDVDFDRLTYVVNYDRPYTVIFSREKITMVAGVDAASPHHTPLKEWRWWTA